MVGHFDSLAAFEVVGLMIKYNLSGCIRAGGVRAPISDAVVICDETATNQAAFIFLCTIGKGSSKCEDKLRRASKELIKSVFYVSSWQ